ncbi:Endonuclease YncB, thermonuclease family [Tenacibaculum sp. MAR_2010_89]|uniref:thermonuclease family protein n=1 Tax=Tenacibaculum sp. MAR_2010_89 TaxID=1250198 RepID=UPI00089B6081|nr:thermonuclease family protein [Tenacibaculum sp. MAR_2010_89]SEE50024.1 Endonuclease YncB, thermonuclease family [Tenacibaculum sp. MAR_2010_89]
MHLKTIFLFLLFFIVKQKVPKEFYAKVIGVKDGDTIEVLYKKKPLIIRLAHIDCPEKKQAFGNKAKQFVATKIFGKNVRIINKGKWHWNRLIAEVYYNKVENINETLVENGLAMHFKKYSKSKRYHNLEQVAKKQKIGIWSQPNSITPWQYRKSNYP